MPTRPRSLTFVGWLFIAIGAITILNDVAPLLTSRASEQWAALGAQWPSELGPAWGLRLLAIIAGVFVLRGANWARWVLVAWIAFHVAISASVPVALAVHALLGVVIAYVLFRPSASAYFRGTGVQPG